MRACPRCGDENSDHARFCQACAAPLTPAGSPGEIRKTVTVVFADVAGSTSLGERMDPETLRHLMGRYFDVMKAAIERHEGTVEKFIGDAVMAVFGVPLLHEDDALRAVRAAVEMREALTSLNVELVRDRGVTLAMRTGVNTGEVVAGDPSTGQRMITGDAVNVAARLEESAKPDEILVGGPTVRLVRDAVVVEPVEPLALKGKRDPMPAFRLLSVSAEPYGFARRFDSPMVGRDRQLAALEWTFESVVLDHAPHLFTVLGDAGVGKTRLANEFLLGVEGRATVLRSRCLSYGEGMTFWPVIEMLRQAAVVGETNPFVAIRDRFKSILERDPEAERLTERLVDLVGISGSGDAPEETFWAVRRFLENLATQRPVVFVIDDLNWGEPTLFDLVEYIADWSREAPILLLCLARPELLDRRPVWGGGKLNASSMLLEPLSDHGSEELIRNLLGTSEYAEPLGATIVQAAEGNPLFVEEMLAVLVDEGRLIRADGRWIGAGDPAVPVPPTMHALLSARIDLLGHEERNALECASVEGSVFHLDAVAELAAPEDRSGVQPALMSLMRKELIRPVTAEQPGEVFRFRHQLVRDVTYESVAKERRAVLHERVAAWLERGAAERPEGSEGSEGSEEILGYHLEQACRLRAELGPVDEAGLGLARRAAALLATSGRRARNRGDERGAVNLLRRAAWLSRPEDPSRARLWLDLGDSLTEIGELAQARRLLTEGRELAEAAEDRIVEEMAALSIMRIRALTEPTIEMDEVRRTAAEAIRMFEALGDDAGLARAWRLMYEVHANRRELEQEREACERVVAHARRAEDGPTESEAASWLVVAIFNGPDAIDPMLERYAAILEQAARYRRVEAALLVARGVDAAIRGEFDQARSLVASGRAILLELGLELNWAGASMPAAFIELVAGAPDRAEAELSAGCRILESAGETSGYSTAEGMLSMALLRSERFEDARAAARTCRDSSAAEDLDSQKLWRVTEGVLAAREGDVETAVRLAGEAFELERDSPGMGSGDVLLELAEVFRGVGSTQQAQEALEEALRVSQRTGNVVTAGKVRSALAELVQ
jgi:class 3 adenylate cyclase/tetratricopeptide (TPR) repeat protein